MTKLADKLKARTLVEWHELDGVKIGVKKLTRAELKKHAETIENVEDDSTLAGLFAEMLIDENGEQALTVDDMENVLTNEDLKQVLEWFNMANGLQGPEETEKN